MKYASTAMINGVETIVTVLSMNLVPGFDPENPPQENTYGVDEIVQVGWIKQSDGTFAAPPTAPPAPLSVSPYQIRAALTQSGLRSQVEAAVAASDSQTIKDAWEYSQRFIENDPFILQIATALDQTTEQVHSLFELALTLDP